MNTANSTLLYCPQCYAEWELYIGCPKECPNACNTLPMGLVVAPTVSTKEDLHFMYWEIERHDLRVGRVVLPYDFFYLDEGGDEDIEGNDICRYYWGAKAEVLFKGSFFIYAEKPH